MSQLHRPLARTLLVLACSGLVLPGLVPSRADFEQQATLTAETLVFRNLIGEIEVIGHDGPDFVVDLRVQGSDADAESVKIETKQGRQAEVTVRFPVEESRHFVYPRVNGTTSFSLDDGRSWLSKLFGQGRIKVSDRGSGLEIWVDATVRVPRGHSAVIDLGVGRIHASDVRGDLELGTRSGPVEVSAVVGAVVVDTGSGSVVVRDVDGELHVDTGSGGVKVNDVRCETLNVDTGSGRVELDDVDCPVVLVDTGSGGVVAEGVRADDVDIDTGSGSVRLDLERIGPGKIRIDTGSGGVKLFLPPDASAKVTAETGSGGIQLDLAGAHEIHHRKDDSVRLTVGGGATVIDIDTGSGGVRITQ